MGIGLGTGRAPGRSGGRGGEVCRYVAGGRGDRKVGRLGERSSDGVVAYFSRRTLGQSRRILFFQKSNF